MPHIPGYGGYSPYIETQPLHRSVARPMAITRPEPSRGTQDRELPQRPSERMGTLYGATFASRPEAYRNVPRAQTRAARERSLTISRSVTPSSMYASTIGTTPDIVSQSRPSTSRTVSTQRVGADRPAVPEATTVRPETSPSVYHNSFRSPSNVMRAYTPFRETRVRFDSVDTVATSNTRGTHHIPGYTGFIPKAQTNETAMKQGMMVEPRPAPVSKSILRETFARNTPGYSGHQPRAAINDRGPVQPNTRSVYGSEFQNRPRSSREPLVKSHIPIYA